MNDFFDHPLLIPVTTASIPSGGWCLLTLNDKDKYNYLARLGAHKTHDGKIVSIHIPASAGDGMEVSVKKADGSVIIDRPSLTPAHFVVVNSNGHNLITPTVDENGHGMWQDVRISTTSPILAKVEPLTSLKDMPPSRRVSLTWAETKLGKKLPNEIIEQALKAKRDWACVGDIVHAAGL